jgi:hypothetical protein
MKEILGFIVMIGNPFEGLSFDGPFETFEDAEEYIEKYYGFRSCETWVASLTRLDDPKPKPDLSDASEAIQIEEIRRDG